MKKRLFAVLLALVLVLSMAVVPANAYALVRPTSHTQVSSLAGISSVTVNGTAAYYEQDSNTNSNEYFIRALLPNASTTENAIQGATVVITTTGSTPVVKFGNTVQPVSSSSGNAYTYALDLLNKAYTVTVGSNTYTLAAGIDDGQVGISSTDPLRLSGTLAGVTLNVYGVNQQNPYMGNPFYSGWTYINYFVTGTLPMGTNLSSVNGTFTIARNASFSGGGVTGTGTTVSGSFNFSSNTNITISKDGNSRNYTAKLAVTGSSIIIQETSSGYRNYDINLSEVIGSSYYTGTVKTEVDAINTAWNAYIATPRTFSSGTSVMDVLEAFITWAEGTNIPGSTTKYFTGISDTGGGYYLSSLNGLAAFDCGDYSGYMYTDDPSGYYWTSQTVHSSIPNIGADGMLITNTGRYTWFYTIDYTNWVNWTAED